LSGNKTHFLCHINFSEIRAHKECDIDTEAYEFFHDINTIGRHIDAVCVPNTDGKNTYIQTYLGSKVRKSRIFFTNQLLLLSLYPHCTYVCNRPWKN